MSDDARIAALARGENNLQGLDDARLGDEAPVQPAHDKRPVVNHRSILGPARVAAGRAQVLERREGDTLDARPACSSQPHRLDGNRATRLGERHEPGPGDLEVIERHDPNRSKSRLRSGCGSG